MQISDISSSIAFLEIYSETLLIGMISVVIVLTVLGCIRLYFLNNSHNAQYSKKVNGNPKVSIHLAICNEPPRLVIDTIKSVKKLNYQNFELLVISNNTSDAALWKPVEEYMHTLDLRFNFIHFEKLDGYKAGALNIALQCTEASVEYIFTLDADYVLCSDALDIALGTIQKREVQLLQFPQSYRNVSTETNGVEINYKHYFDCYLSSSKSKILALPTGTLTLIDRNVFQNDVEWPTDSITEDASFGVELIARNMKIGFCNHVIGKGTMPTEPIDYSKQYKRWVFGNFQVLAKVWRSKGISVLNKIHLSTLLTAWLNVLGFVFGILVLATPLLFMNSQVGILIFYVGLVGILLHCIIQITIYRKIAGNDLVKGWNGFLIHLGLLEIGSFYWMNYFIKKDRPFVRTSKFLKADSKTNRFYVFPFLWFIISAFSFLLQHYIIAVFFMLFAVQLSYAKFHKDQEIIWSKFNLYKMK